MNSRADKTWTSLTLKSTLRCSETARDFSMTVDCIQNKVNQKVLSRENTRHNTHVHPIFMIFSLIAAFYVTPFTYSLYAKHKHTYIFFISIILILRLYFNNAFKASTAILSDAMILSIAMMLPVYVIWYYVCNMMKKVGRKVTNKICKNGRNE